MSRYRNSGNFAYQEPPPPTRWDADRFARERDYRQTEEYYQPAPPPQRRPTRPVYEEERYYYEDDRNGPQGAYQDRRYFEEDEYYDPRAQRGQVIPFRPPPRPEAPPRPGLIRRQSSLDTFDRPSARRYADYETYRPTQRAPPRQYYDVPEPQGPGGNRYRQSRQYDDYQGGYYDDVAIQDPDYYGDEGFREFREREWVRQRRRSTSGSRSRERPPTEAPVEKKETVRKEEIREEIKEKPYPRRGKTKMPKRLVHTKVLFDLGYPFYEEGEKTLIIEKALGPENIDEVFAKSREYREKEVSTTRLIEAPPAPPRAPSPAPQPRSSVIQQEILIKETEVQTKPISEAPRSVREWDQLSVKEDTRSVHSGRRSHARSRSTVVDRSPSPDRSRYRKSRSKSKRRSRSESSDDETEIIKRKIVTEDDVPEESASIHVGPLALVVDRNKKSDRDIKREIRELEAEQRALRRERRSSRISSDYVRIERRASRSPSPIRVERIRPERQSRSPSPVRVERIRIDERNRSPSPRRVERIRIDERTRSPSPRRMDRYDRQIIVDRRSPVRDDYAVERIERVNRRESVPDRVIIDRRSEPENSDLIIEKRGDEVVEVRKARRDRSFSRSRQPSAGLIKGMLYAVT